MKTSHEAEKNTTTGSSQQNEASLGTLSEGVRQQNMQPFQENKQIKL